MSPFPKLLPPPKNETIVIDQGALDNGSRGSSKVALRQQRRKGKPRSYSFRLLRPVLCLTKLLPRFLQNLRVYAIVA